MKECVLEIELSHLLLRRERETVEIQNWKTSISTQKILVTTFQQPQFIVSEFNSSYVIN